MPSATSMPAPLALRLVTALVHLLSPLALLAALSVLLVPKLRRASPYFAYHGVQAALWQLVSNCFTAGIYVGVLLAGLTQQGWEQYVLPDINNLFTAPHLLVQRWPIMFSTERLAVLLLLGLLALNFVVVLVGVVVILTGRVYRLPVLGAICAPLLRRPAAPAPMPAGI